MAEAAAYKNIGNNLFKEGKFIESIEQYSKAI